MEPGGKYLAWRPSRGDGKYNTAGLRLSPERCGGTSVRISYQRSVTADASRAKQDTPPRRCFRLKPRMKAVEMNDFKWFRGQIIAHCPSVKHSSHAPMRDILHRAAPSHPPSIKSRPLFIRQTPPMCPLARHPHWGKLKVNKCSMRPLPVSQLNPGCHSAAPGSPSNGLQSTSAGGHGPQSPERSMQGSPSRYEPLCDRCSGSGSQTD
ncbi:hypothetical protein EYF80_023847 [Liparis tanakae]|uniref:Uncharacterized protein n=1 Tax=Liparis tanakae TaxID=230148 RepID=A0A4Z2HM09_9TELE|nr:hypothetical protein EYF80_023847 [Liparis tanakae]